MSDAGASDSGSDAGAEDDAGFDAGPGDDDAGVDGGADAGTLDGGQSDAGALDGGLLVCVSGWCWQNPAFPPVTLHAVWGSSDDDVYVGGTGGMVFHYDGARWALAQPVSEGVPRWSVVTSGAAAASNTNWVCGPDVGARRFIGPQGDDTVDSPSCATVAQYGTQLAFADSVVNQPILIGGSYNSASMSPVGLHDAGSTVRSQIGLGANDEWAVIDEGHGGAQWVITPQGAAPGISGGDEFSYSFQAHVLRPGPDGSLQLLASGNATSVRAQHDSGVWSPVRSMPSTNHDDMRFHDGTWWYSGGGQVFAEAPDGGLTLVTQQPYVFSTSLWASAGTSLWMAGTNGQIFKITGRSSGDVVHMTVPVQPKIYDLVVKGPPETWRAFGTNGAEWRYDADRWSLDAGTGLWSDTVLAADWFSDAGYFLLHMNGRVGVPGGNTVSLGTGEIEPLSGFERSHGAIAAVGATEVWAAMGDRFARVLIDGGVPYVAFTAPLAMSHATGLVVYAQAPEQYVVHVSMTNVSGGVVGGGQVSVFEVQSNALIDSGTLINLPEAVYGLERGPSESSYALTASSVRGCASHTAATCDVCTDLPSPAEMGPVEADSYQDLYPMSLTVAAGRMALVDSVGRVYEAPIASFCADGANVPTALPWPRGKNVPGEPLPSRIKSNGTRLFVVGERGSIVVKPLP